MQYYNQIAPGYNELYEEEQSKKISIIRNNIKMNQFDSLLDVGCGTGISSKFDCTVVGIDPSIGLLSQNKSKMKAIGIAEALPFKDNSFDHVISVTSIHNFSDISKAMAEFKRVGKNSFVFSVLMKSNGFNRIKGLIERNFAVTKVFEEEKDRIFFCEKV